MHHDPVSDLNRFEDAGRRGHRHQVQAARSGHRRKQHYQLPRECVSKKLYFIILTIDQNFSRNNRMLSAK